VIIFNEGQDGRTDAINGTLGGPGVTIPVLGTTFAVGNDLAGTGDTVHIVTDTFFELRSTENVIADSTSGRTDRTVVVGAHLDSVEEGPGINDNGSGSAAILETALQMADKGIEPRNRVRFAFWGAEEAGLLGSEHYVASLTKAELKDIMLNLNFDMVSSPNYVRFVYDGDGSATDPAGPNGSGRIESVFTEYFDSQDLPSEPTAFSGRSDYGPFIAVGIPAGGLFTGAEVVKTEDQEAIYGGVAGASYDPCYHAECDSLDPTYDSQELMDVYAELNAEYDMVGNVNLTALGEMSDAAAHATMTFAMTTSSVNGTGRASS
jgi:Zn-dependent M28 family amino/carboxypeptidase